MKMNLLVAAVGAFVSAAIVGAVAWAQIPDTRGVIHACFTGVLRDLTPSERHDRRRE